MRLRIPIDLLRSPRLLAQAQSKAPLTATTSHVNEPFFSQSRSLAQIRPDTGGQVTSLVSTRSSENSQELDYRRRTNGPSPDERNLKLGKSK
jgi:hypothetical protein